MARQIPSFRMLRSFESVVETGSLTAAARQLNVTTGAISRQISALEADLGVALLMRQGRGIVATERGRVLAQKLSAAFAEIAAALDDAASSGSELTITLNGLPTFVIHWLVPRLGDLQIWEPEIDLRLRTSAREDRFDHPDIDVAIEIGPTTRPGMISIPILERAFVPVCSPATLAESAISCFDDLRRVRIFYSDLQVPSWRLWLQHVGAEPFDITANGVRFENSSLAYQAVRSGRGIAIGQPVMLQDELDLGILVKPFAEIYKSDVAYHVVYPERSADWAELRRFIEWLCKIGHL